MRHGFGLNTNLLETNILNLVVVIRIVVTVVGDALNTLLVKRRQMVLLTIEEVDKKAQEAQQQLESARASVETARLRAQEIRIQALQEAEKESSAARDIRIKDLQRLQEMGKQEAQLERQRTVRSISQQVANLALASAEKTLRTTLRGQGSSARSKQEELNERYVSGVLSMLGTERERG